VAGLLVIPAALIPIPAVSRRFAGGGGAGVRSSAGWTPQLDVHSGSDEGDLSDSPAVSLVVENYRPCKCFLPQTDRESPARLFYYGSRTSARDLRRYVHWAVSPHIRGGHAVLCAPDARPGDRHVRFKRPPGVQSSTRTARSGPADEGAAPRSGAPVIPRSLKSEWSRASVSPGGRRC
jgi:hypothetical protein